MCISITTMGKYWMLPDGGGLVCQGGGSGSYSSFLEENKRKPVVIVDRVLQDKKEDVCVEITGVYYD